MLQRILQKGKKRGFSGILGSTSRLRATRGGQWHVRIGSVRAWKPSLEDGILQPTSQGRLGKTTSRRWDGGITPYGPKTQMWRM
jgi:hypothetical protein